MVLSLLGFIVLICKVKPWKISTNYFVRSYNSVYLAPHHILILFRKIYTLGGEAEIICT
jgi:hypothetical protein